MDLISVIVPVYKVESYLDACVESIVGQTYHNLEIILVDDGSPDRCPAMCDAWAEKDERIRVIHKENGGAATARNAGLEIARGEYIGFVDSDDMIRPDMYEILLNALHGSQKKIAYCDKGWNPELPYQRESSQCRELGVEETVKDIFAGRVGTALWRRLYCRSVWEKLRLPEGEINEDFPVLIPAVVAADGMVDVGEKLYFYRDTPGSVTATYWKNNTRIVLKNLRRMYTQLEECGLNCLPQFRDFAIRSVYYGGLALDKHLEELSEIGRQDHQKHLRLMRKMWIHAMFGNALKLKDKILYSLVVAHLLRPIYKMIGKL